MAAERRNALAIQDNGGLWIDRYNNNTTTNNANNNTNNNLDFYSTFQDTQGRLKIG